MAVSYNLNDHRQHQYHPRNNNYTVCKKPCGRMDALRPDRVNLRKISPAFSSARNLLRQFLRQPLRPPNQTVPHRLIPSIKTCYT